MTGTYRAFGLTLCSDLDLPELVEDDDSPSVWITRGEVPERLIDPRPVAAAVFEANRRRFLMRVDGIARFAVEQGRTIIVDRFAQATDEDVRAMLLGVPIGALLHQRGFLALHASAIDTPRGAVLFAGHSGTGKSTLAAAFMARGHRIMSDDLSAISVGEHERPMVHPGFPQLKLCADSAARLGHAVGAYRRVRPAVDKFAVPAVAQFTREARPLSAIYVLETHNRPETRLEPRTGVSRVTTLRTHTFTRRSIASLDLAAAHFLLVSAVARAVPVTAVTRPRDGFDLDDLVDRISCGILP